MAPLRVANSIRLILAMFRLYADIEAGFGKAILDILKKQYPDQDVDANPSQVGHKLMNIARKQLQGSDQDAMDAIQELLTYLTTGPKFERDEEGKVVKDPETGEPMAAKEPKPWDFTKDSDTWQKALDKIYSNLRTTAMGGSMGKMRRRKKERTIEEAFGRRPEGGGAPEGGEERMPTGDETLLGKALDDKAAVKEFIDLVDEHIPDLRSALSDDSRKLFDLIFEDEVGDFGSDVKANMGQATALKEKHPELYEANAKRWSGFVGDLRKKLLKEIWDYIETEMSHNDFVRLRDQFFADVDPSAVRKMEREKEEGKASYQRMLDENKVARLKAKLEKEGELSGKDQKDFDRLSNRLKEQGVDVDAIKPDEHAGAGKRKKKDEDLQQVASVMLAAMTIASSPLRPTWV